MTKKLKVFKNKIKKVLLDLVTIKVIDIFQLKYQHYYFIDSNKKNVLYVVTDLYLEKNIIN